MILQLNLDTVEMQHHLFLIGLVLHSTQVNNLAYNRSVTGDHGFCIIPGSDRLVSDDDKLVAALFPACGVLYGNLV